MARLRAGLREHLPWPLHFVLRKVRAVPEDLPIVWRFLSRRTTAPTSFRQRLRLVAACYRISYSVDSPHMESEIVSVIAAILSLPRSVEGTVVEAGSYKGSSTAKLSIAARVAGRQLVAFDSFTGIPEHREKHGPNIFGGPAHFPAGSYAGSLEEVTANVARHGAVEACRFIQGWFDDTLPAFDEPVAGAYVDVDLESSTRTCLRYLYPLLISDGTLFSQDGHLPWVIRLLDDDAFWRDEVGCAKPTMEGLGRRKLVAIRKH